MSFCKITNWQMWDIKNGLMNIGGFCPTKRKGKQHLTFLSGKGTKHI